MASPWPLTFSSGERPRALWALLFYSISTKYIHISSILQKRFSSGLCVCFQDKVRSREWRTQAALSHVGVSILSSAVTTIIAAIPLTQTTIQPFAKFGQIIAINTSVCILYSLTLCVALLSTIGPAFFKPNWMSFVKSVVGTVVVVGLSVLVMFIVSRFGVEIPGPNGGSLFWVVTC